MEVEISAIMRIATRQYGCITTDQALAVMTKNQWNYLARVGIVTRKWPGSYVVTGFEPTWQQQAVAAMLSLPGSALSHRSAARWWGLRSIPSARVELTTPVTIRTIRDGIRLHCSEQLEPYVNSSDAIRVTNVARTLVDLSSCTSPERLSKALDEACNKKLVTLEEVEYCLDRMVTKGRKRISYLREALGSRTSVDENLDSFLERRTLKWLREWGVMVPASQVGVIANGTYYRVDLCFPEAKIAVEPDGPHHLLPSVAAYDRQRDADLNLEGWIVFHVYENTRPDDFIPRLRIALKKRATDTQHEL